MKTRNSTKSKLLSSVIALVLCVSMLIGATFAWFTDAASTGVNKIQAGTLDVALEYSLDNGATWQNAEGRTLSWQKATDHESEPVLWEPGCSYALPQLRIVNKGTLALKYKIAINGIIGDAGLMKALEFTVSGVDNAANTNDLNGFEGELAANATTQAITITGKMKTDAGNEYQGLSIDGIGITVYATQKVAENDSFGNTYDQNAGYIERHATIMGDDGKTITLEKGKTYTVGNGAVEVDANGNITYTDDSTTPQTVTINTAGGTLTVNAPNATVNHYGESDNVVITAVAGNSYHEFGKVAVLELAKGRVVVENGDNIGIIQVKANNAESNPVVIAVPQNVVLDTKIEKDGSVDKVSFQVGSATVQTVNINSTAAGNEIGTVENAPSELEKVLGSTVADAGNYVARIGNEPYETLADAVAANKSGNIVLMSNIELTRLVKITDNRTIDMNGYNISSKNTYALFVNGGTLNLIGKGVVSATGESMSGDRSVIFVGDEAYSWQSSWLNVGKDVTVSTDKCYGITYYGKGSQKVVIDGTVSVTGPSPAISGNGTYKGATVTVNGTVSSQNTNAIYNPQGGTLTVNGTVSGKGGIEAKAGNVVVNDGAKITATASSTSHKAYGNGCSTDGYAIAVVNNSGYTHGPARVTVKGGTVIGDLGIVDDNSTTSGSITITGGSFTDLVSALKYAASDATIGLAQDAQGGGLSSADGAKVRENLTIDFNGHTYTMENPAVGSTGTESQAMHWGKSLGAITLKNGTFKVASGADNVGMAMQNYINFTAENMNFDFSAIPVDHYGDWSDTEYEDFSYLEIPMFNANGAPITMTNCTVKMPAESTKGITADEATITLTNCTIDGYVCCVDTDSKVINNDSTWKGFVSYFDNYVTKKNGNEYYVVLSTSEAE